MAVQGPLSHLDLSCSEPRRAIPFYAAFFEALGYRRLDVPLPDFQEPTPERACWALRLDGGAWFGVEVRPAQGPHRTRPVDRYAPGLHHMAFHAPSRAAVDRVHAAMTAAGGTVLDPPAEYHGPAYSPGYYAAFYADPDGLKLEVVHEPRANPAP